jgi:hypothetical protein
MNLSKQHAQNRIEGAVSSNQSTERTRRVKSPKETSKYDTNEEKDTDSATNFAHRHVQMRDRLNQRNRKWLINLR